VTLAARLRGALERGHARPVELLPGDDPDLVARPGQVIVPAAVLVAVVDRPNPAVILTLRTDSMRRHAGQVSFPGGRIDPEDSDPVDAALREAEEEIGLRRDQVEVVATADSYRTVTGYHVTPVIGVVPPGLSLTPQPSEVAAIFEVPLDHLLDPVHHRIRTTQWQGDSRTYYEICWQDRRIWGATAAMIVNLSRRIELVA
jgi:8-oxo-dGTP pyrophosphatase MutT (NUDIX family)